ncbi:MAG: response regulator [Endomicrobiales bacterium]|nr:response regulator [Endomicrobiales bacterium]
MKKTKILIVDDDSTIAHACERALNITGYDVKCAGTGEEAVEILKEEQFSIVVLDLQMPGMSGMEVLRHIKSKTPDCDVIITTAYPSVDTAIESLRIGVYDYIKKPFSINELRKKIRECIESRIEKERFLAEKIEGVLTIYQICKSCNVSKTTVNNWMEQGLLDSYEVPGGRIRIKKNDFFKFLKQYNLEEIFSEKEE